MICPVITGPSFQEAKEQIEEAISRKCSIVELRLDFFQNRTCRELKSLRDEFPIQMIFTLRCKSQGGQYTGNEEDRLKEILELADCKPDFFDLEYSIPLSFLEEFKDKFPQIKQIISYHQFYENNLSLKEIFADMPKVENSLYKIAVYSDFTTEALKTLIQKESYPQLILINMGECGQVSRILSPIYGNFITYACLDANKKTARGQLSLDELQGIYHQDTINKDTKIYGLIGNPISESIGHHCHNAIFFEHGLNSVYMKLKIVNEELRSFFKLAQKLGFSGLSVTMPHKEAILPMLDEIEPTAKIIGAVNTVVFENERCVGYNTDGMGALNALEKYSNVKDKKIIVLGAGGAARSIVYESMQRGAQVTVINRSLKNAENIANAFGCNFASFSDMEKYYDEGYDILINCTPDPMPIDSRYLKPFAFIMDITTNPVNTLFLSQAIKAGCHIIPGFEMFIQQAIGQLNLWFPGKFDKIDLYEKLKKCALSKL